ncbi:MAG TPA: hypothetical protein VFK35_12155 [Candidatus Limnocylindrales bacterium]|nr:hypothetical protein [Candidatus Limnocylindrales bacterium]
MIAAAPLAGLGDRVHATSRCPLQVKDRQLPVDGRLLHELEPGADPAA